jgi:hypothetical protein
MNSSWGRDQWVSRNPEEWSPFPGEYVMAADDKPRSGRPSGDGSRPRGKAPGDRPFDIWLQKQLHAMYDEIASEPLPKDLLGLIDRDAATTGGKKVDTGKDPTTKKKAS